eukprot:CAMPEP_0171188954 /NCGR_PEP_ID=MMETSP0790-20130122/18099_1 /TAXON_ID=2925 /ORGANISM="Alexandrium catenella, Strain OF101" /LENGTH=159 /DNA_ID=CAMNT_0011654055 /DNA_START=43 /DNA_END=522 /DNA_ORIENTATION=-
MSAMRRRSSLAHLAALVGLALAVQLLGQALSFVAPPRGQPSQPGDGAVASARLGRRTGTVAGLLGLALFPGVEDQAQAKSKKPLGSDDYGDDVSGLDGLLKKDWNKALDETRCKTWDEGERRGFCVTKEINDKNRKKAAAEGKGYTDQKATLSKGSYGV